MTKRRKGTKATLVRKGEASLDHMAIVSDYQEGNLTVSEIATLHGTTENNVGLIANRFWKGLTNMKESRALMAITSDKPETHFSAKHSMKQLNGTELINQGFLSLLSDDATALLTDEESTYCWIYAHTGDSFEALTGSGLDVGLHTESGEKGRFSYDRACVLRGLYLNAKPNVAEYVQQLREVRLQNANVGKAQVQSELIDQLEQMKASGQTNKHRMAMIRTIELLGKTVGAFVERVEVTEINANDALDELIHMAKSATDTYAQEPTDEKGAQ